jgi:hypothetical protein
MGLMATAATMDSSNDLKSEATFLDQRMLVMEMWNWYQPNSEKLTNLMATLDQVIFNFLFKSILELYPVKK